jgi:dynein heavy chain
MTMLGSRFIKTIQEDVEEWSKKLAVLSETLDEWLVCQKTWMYLENIFGAEDIQKQLPAESQKFLIVDRSWKVIMNRTNTDPLCLSALEPLDSGVLLLDQFNMNNAALDSIQKSLEEYLETKRMAFPRFYFLSNDELLEIMSQTRDPHAVQPHVGKCFDSIKRIKFGEHKHAHDILGFFDPGGEYVQLSEQVKAAGPVEGWLLAFEKGMRQTLYDNCKHGYEQYPVTDEGAIERHKWLWSYPAQAVIAIDQVMWTANGTAALMKLEGTYDEGGEVESDAMEKFLDFSLKQIDAMVELVRQPLDNQQRMLLGALLTIDVHARDVTRALVRKEITQLSDFEWTKQLRYYWEEKEDDVFAKQTNSSFQYGYEYLGNGFRLVITPLTDLCYMTLTGALHMRLGGAPAGPAGTGKTETTKDLAKALAVYCVVFNCSDGLDYKIMGRFFSGLAQQGAWACFDEFNRIDIEVLSVIAQQILSIQQAITKNLKEFDFEGNVIPLNYSFGVFITMNPGYAGRTELPDNLKSLFRPVAMMVPDYRLIAEIMLFSEGFANALPLSNKMAQLYALSSEQLSKQSHYDFGMRAVKTVLVAAGQLKRKEPDTFEDLLLIRAMRDSNVPKFLEQDIPLFGGILKDLFPGIQVPYVDYGKLQTAIETALENNNLQKPASRPTQASFQNWIGLWGVTI